MCRKCIICGKDISHLKSNAKLCGDKKCEYAYAKIRKATKDDDRFCEICGDKINDLPRQRKICLKEECIRQQKIRKYHSALKTKICERCGNEFEGTYKQKLCPQCRENRKPLERKEIEVTLYCKYCKKPIGKEVRLMTILSSTEDYTFVCDECKQAHREETAERMRQHNPMFDKNVSKKVAKTKRQKYAEKCLSENKIPSKPHVRKGETKEETAERMRQHNPMFDKNVSKKVAKTLKQRYKDGTIPKHFGKDNWNWKGNRNFNKAVRINLRKWVKEMFIKNNFTCQICGKNKGELHVHHIEPLRDIISNFMEKENYTIEYINDIEGTDEYQEFINKIVKYHYDNDNIGIVLCPECHAKIDRQYRLRKK